MKLLVPGYALLILNKKFQTERKITFFSLYSKMQNVSFIPVSPQIPGVKSADVYEGDTAILACLVSSFPSSNITWRRHGHVLYSNNKYIINSNYTLQIKNTVFQDAGDYECEVTNELGGAVANVKLFVGCKYNRRTWKPLFSTVVYLSFTLAFLSMDISIRLNISLKEDILARVILFCNSSGTFFGQDSYHIL